MEQMLSKFGAETAINNDTLCTHIFIVSYVHIQCEVSFIVAQNYFAVCLENILSVKCILSSARCRPEAFHKPGDPASH